MAEGCPLGTGLYWENENDIPDFCQKNCGHLFENTGVMTPDGDYDVFPDDGSGDACEHTQYALETEDCSLQRGNGAERIFSVTDECGGCGIEWGAQSYKFTCSAEDQN